MAIDNKHLKITEEASHYDELEQMDTLDIISSINNEDKKVAEAVERVLPQIAQLVDELTKRFEKGGRLFYIGAGTSGRLGILDASEIPPTFGMPHDRVIGLIAGAIVQYERLLNLPRITFTRPGRI